MKADFWLEKWEQNQIGFHEDEINSHLQTFFSSLNIPQKSKVFVPLCGKSKDILWLRSQGYEVLGVELSPIAVSDFFSENDLEPKISDHGNFKRWEAEDLCIYQGDFFDLSNEDLVNCTAIYDRASLIALPLDMRQQYVDHLRSIADAISHTLLVTLEYDQSEMQGPPFSVNKSTVNQLFEKHCNVELLLKEDILSQNEHFIKRGLTRLIESIYILTKG